MDTVFQQYKKCAIKIVTEVSGVPKSSSGFLIKTSSFSKFDYVFTTKHTFCEDDNDIDLFIDEIEFIELYLERNLKLEKLVRLQKKFIYDRFIEFDTDLVLLLIEKLEDTTIPNIQVSDEISNECISWSITKALPDEIHRLDFKKNDPERKRYTISNFSHPQSLKGCSGSGFISTQKPVLHGFIMRHPTDELEGNYVDAINLTFEDINRKLFSLGLELLCVENQSKLIRNIADKKIINIEEAKINGVVLNLLQATRRIIVDCQDDWFHDPLSFVDLRNTDFLFEFFQEYFLGKNYVTSKSEIFFLPKSSFTLRKALLISYTDRLFYTALVDKLGTEIDESLLPIVYSSRYNNSSKGGLIIPGIEQWKKMMYLIQTYSKEYNYIIEIDILNFYDNINTDLLCDKLLTICESTNNRNAVKELRSVLCTFSNQSKSGIPQNNDASSLLATFYLNEVDSYMFHQVPKYLRFMDDIKIFCNDEFDARKYLTLIEMKLRELKLSLNSQKTKIINLKPLNEIGKKEIKEEYQSFFNLERSKLSTLSSSDSYNNRNEAFHLATKLILKHLNEDTIGVGKNERSLLQALTILKKSKVRGVSFEKYKSEINDILEKLPTLLKERPWITSQIVYLITIIDIKLIPVSTWDEIIEIVTNIKYNIYHWQCYHLWLMLAKHKIKDPKLSIYASKFLDSNDDLNRPVIAALMIYMGSIDENYRRIVLGKFKNDFTDGYFQKRAALITLRNFHTEDVCSGNLVDTAVHVSLYKNKDKELVFVNGESDEDYSDLIEMYSL
ncbi:MAG: RNA-directed DNA polymerase [Saprospiraceae bacterium]|nr:RNA-directed DNA polymerase [Saprospiraceae bacterium]